ncbi:MAG: glycosyl hydrolase 115 family protein [Bacteroidales bacterium]|nr:glycosyl hydrolase 115 family protein [Bacteroidales bacterium]
MHSNHFLPCLLAAALLLSVPAFGIDFPGITKPGAGGFPLISEGRPAAVVTDPADSRGIQIAAETLREDFARVCGQKAPAAGERAILAGSVGSPLVQGLAARGLIDLSVLQGQYESYFISTLGRPVPGYQDALVIVGADMRGTIYGLYEISEQIGVSPWYDWADVPVRHREDLSLEPGTYIAPQPAVRYRGIFLNDEAPCLTTWVKNSYGTDYGDHRFYARVFELLLRLRANFMWPAMWDWAFYADDPQNSRTAHEMGIIMGTSHHEPMARNHQEWVRKHGSEGAWDYQTNRKVLDRFFAEGVRRAADTEDLITIGMRGDGDAALGKEGHEAEYIKLMESIIGNQRRIIRRETGRPAEERPQVWALYKEVQQYYDLGLRVPDDVTILLSDDNWGNVRKLPTAAERNRKGGWGIYYHVDYVGAPRNSKWLNVTPIQNMWEQLQLTYAYGVDRLWVLNVGDLKPMEYPIDLFLALARTPDAFSAENLLDHTRAFCARAFGEDQADEAARILNLYSKYSGRTTAEMMDYTTFDLASGEFRRVSDDFARLEAEALRQFLSLDPEARDAYRQLILFPVQALSNLYEMYYAQAMNLDLYTKGDPAADDWADRVERCFARDAFLAEQYNKEMSGGKWDGMMTQKHIGYFSWNDNFPADRLPQVKRLGPVAPGGFSFPAAPGAGYTAIEAEHYFAAPAAPDTRWTVIPYMGRTLSGVALMPYTAPAEGAALRYRFELPAGVSSVKVHVITKSTLAFNNSGHRYEVVLGGRKQTQHFNALLNEDPQNIYSVYYPTVARRVVETVSELPATAGWTELELRPLDPGIVFEKIVIDYGGYTPQFLFGEESPVRRAAAE